MERLSDRAIEILDELHTERLDYHSEYLPLIEAAHKLAEYEATGFEPGNVQEIRNEILYSSAFGVSMTRERFDAICNAERDGRLLALPCKMRDTLWDRQLEAWTVISIEWFSKKVTQIHCVSPVNGRRNTFSVGKRSLGKTVFLTREEAEAALKQKQEADA